ncbi:SET domain-containing protein-lysine N-methyltransferase [Lacibacter luteus]|uniref:SET domain-containing protein-lysine N-methyltransferase n=1 Tax=Lacibacter luteus TaxID=2508719 RepID=A0A4Q1CNR8_9BACT|nr:SET domain-containing protein [Lacibacter luteus]RXK62778.1 SET domain-containing protein-lysine N-methyltransferase [Lacibacter luteus]
MRLPDLYIDNTADKGRGVFTEQGIDAGEIIEMAPVIVMSAAERVLLDQTLLHDYIFEWGEGKTECAMALGWIPVYNHSYASNAEYFMDFEEGWMFVKSVRSIAPGEEITINYNGNWDDKKVLWFEAK